MQKLKVKALKMFGLAPIILGVIFFVPAGSFRFWEAWVYSAVIIIPMIFVVNYFLINDSQVLERRMQHKEKELRQKKIVRIGNILFFIAMILPGLDYRFGLSDIPAVMVFSSDAMVLAGIFIYFLVLKENSYASRIIEVQAGQKVISTGPYSVVRHPMYSAVCIMYLFTPIALGSYWAIIPMLLIIPIIVLRILNEEETLKKDLPGYTEYVTKTRYRLIPFIW